MEVQNLSGECLFSPTLIGVTGGFLDFGSLGQGAPYFDPRPFTYQNFKDELTNQYNTAFTPSFKQYLNYEISAFTQCVSSSTSGAMSSFTVEGDNGTPFPITNGDTLEFVGQTGIDIGVADPEVRIAMDYNGADSFIMAATNGTSITVDGANDKLVIYDNDAALVKYINADQLPGGSSYWTADTTPSDTVKYIRTSGNTTSLKVGDNIEMSGTLRTNMISNGSPTTTLGMYPDSSSKIINYGYSTEQGEGTLTTFMTFGFGTPASSDVKIQTFQAGDLVFKGPNGTAGGEMLRLDPTIGQASAYTVTAANSLAVSGHCFIGGRPTDTTDDPKILTIDTEDKVGEQLLSNLNAKINFWTADTTGTNSHYIRTSGNTTGVKIGGNLDVSGNTVADGFIIASGTSATPLSAIKLMYEGDKNIAAFLRVGSGGNADKGRMVLYDNAAEVVEITTLDNGPSYINNVGAALAIGSDGSTEGGAGILSASTISGRTLTLKNDLGVTGDTLISGSIGVGTSPSSKLHISTDDNVIARFHSTDANAGINLSDNSTTNAQAFKRTSNNLTILPNGGMVGIPNSPVTRLDVTHGTEVTSLVNNTGGGESVTFGTVHGGGSLTAGKLYFMTSAGAWRETDADAVNTGSNQLLAIAKGTAVSDGMLIRGFFDVHNAFTGTFNEGVPVYVSTTSGYVSVTQPSGSNDFSRVVGYCTNTANVIYFNPDSTFIKIA